MSFLAHHASQLGTQVRINSGTTVPYRDSDHPEDRSGSEDLNDTKLEDEDLEHDVETLEETPDDRAFIAVETICGICQSECKDPADIECKHVFCLLCLADWVAISSTCPNCRREIRSINNHPIQHAVQRGSDYLQEEWVEYLQSHPLALEEEPAEPSAPPVLIRRNAMVRADLPNNSRPPAPRNRYFG